MRLTSDAATNWQRKHPALAERPATGTVHPLAGALLKGLLRSWRGGCWPPVGRLRSPASLVLMAVAGRRRARVWRRVRAELSSSRWRVGSSPGRPAEQTPANRTRLCLARKSLHDTDPRRRRRRGRSRRPTSGRHSKAVSPGRLCLFSAPLDDVVFALNSNRVLYGK